MLLQTVAAYAFQRDVCFMNFNMKRFFDGMRVKNFADILDLSAAFTKEVRVRMCVTVVPFLPFSVGSDLQNVARFYQKSQVAVNRPQTDIRNLLFDACEDHIRIGVVVTALKIPEDRLPLF